MSDQHLIHYPFRSYETRSHLPAQKRKGEGVRYFCSLLHFKIEDMEEIQYPTQCCAGICGLADPCFVVLTEKSLTVVPNHQLSSTLRMVTSDISGLLKRCAVLDLTDLALPCQEPVPVPWSHLTTDEALVLVAVSSA